jgi:L-ascorbate 6-phosphate lactonase
MSLMQQIRSHRVPPGSIALWWLGQMSFILKSPQAMTIAIDPYLTNSCMQGGARLGVDCDRRFPVLVQPEELAVDVIALTHSHQDHYDPETITRHRTSGFRGPYVAPGETMDQLLDIGVAAPEITLSWPNKEHQFGDLRLKATFAIPPRGDDVTHMGFLLFVDNGPTVYLTGDTDYHDILGYVADYKPDVMLAPINGALNNMGPNEATKLTQKIDPKVVIPCHYDLFPDDTQNPRVFRRCLLVAGMLEKYRLVEHGEAFTYTRDNSAS